MSNVESSRLNLTHCANLKTVSAYSVSILLHDPSFLSVFQSQCDSPFPYPRSIFRYIHSFLGRPSPNRPFSSSLMPGAKLETSPPVSSLSTVAAVEQALAESLALSTTVDTSLDEQVHQAHILTSRHAATLTSATQLATAISHDAEDLHSLLSSAARTSSSSCATLRALHLQLTNATAALAWAEDILMLRVCAEGAKTSLSADDLEGAAAHVERYLALGEEVRADAASATAVSQMEQSRAELARKIRERALRALEEGGLTTPKVLESVKLFVPIGEGGEGLKRLAQYLGERVSAECREDVRVLLVEGREGEGVDEPHLVVFARLFEGVAACVHEVGDKVNMFGEGEMKSLVIVLQGECDKGAEKVWERYKERRGIGEVVMAVGSEGVDARELDGLLDELTLLSQRIEAYFAFLKGWEGVEAVLEGCGLRQIREELGKVYKTLEGYFMRSNAKLAIKIDESNGEEAETSTAVDDFFFVMQKCFQRAFAFGDIDAEVLKVVLQQIAMVLMNDLLVYMKRRLVETEAALEKVFGKGGGTSALPSAAMTVSYLTELAKVNISMPGGTENDGQNADVAKYDFFVALNNAAVSADYATRLRSNVEKSIHASRKLSDDDRSLLAAPIAQVTDASRALMLASENGVSRLASVLVGRVSVIVESSLKAATYVVSEAEYSLDSDATPSFSREVSNEIETKVLSPSLEKRLTEKNWDALVRQVAEWYAAKVEMIVFLPPNGSGNGKSFNAFGGLRADRDVRAISAYFSGKSRRSTVRDVFGRLSQLAMVVNLERPMEIYDVWGPNAGGMTWRLTPAEVRLTLSLRHDFNQEAVRSLKL